MSQAHQQIVQGDTLIVLKIIYKSNKDIRPQTSHIPHILFFPTNLKVFIVPQKCAYHNIHEKVNKINKHVITVINKARDVSYGPDEKQSRKITGMTVNYSHGNEHELPVKSIFSGTVNDIQALSSLLNFYFYFEEAGGRGE